MEIKTEVRATINQIKQLIAEKYNISLDFDLEIVDETIKVGNFVHKHEDKPSDDLWYPDDSGEWVDVEMGKGKPNDLPCCCIIEVLLNSERENKHYIYPSTDKAGDWNFNDIVAYKKVK